MKRAWVNNIGMLLLAASLAACGGDGSSTPGRSAGESGSGNGGNSGGGNSGGGNGGGTGGLTLRGVASKGGPMAGVEIIAVEANSNRGASTTTQADGSFALNVEGLNRPLRLFATNKRAAESFALTNVVFQGQTVAHINEASHAITQAMGTTPTLAQQSQLEDLLENSLDNYLPANPESFVNGAAYRADLTGADGALALVRIAFVGNGILLENRANPAQRVTIDTTASTPAPALLPAVANNQTLDPLELNALVRAFGTALAVNSSNANKFDAVMHPDFQDNDGFNAAKVAEVSNLTDIRIERFEILRCFTDTAATLDKCLVRVVVNANALEEFDFGNPDFDETEVTENFDVIVERRTGTTNPPLKMAGGQYRPFSAKTHLQHVAQTTVQANGNLSSVNPTRTDLVLQVDSANINLDSMLGARANQNVRGASLVRTQNTTPETLLNLRKAANAECAGVFNLVRNPSNSTDCSNQFTVSNLNNLEVDSRNGRVSLGFEINNVAQPQQFGFVRIKRGASVNNAFFPNLNAADLQALHAYGRSNAPATALNIELTPPVGFNQVCIAIDASESTPSICTRETRRVNIPNLMLPARQSSYVLFTTDNEGNQFVRRYNLQ